MSETKRTRKSTPIAVYPEIPATTAAIDSAYIKAYLADNYKKGNISKDELRQWLEDYNACAADKGNRAYFQEYRRKFVSAYFPALGIQTARKSKQESMGDFLAALLEE